MKITYRDGRTGEIGYLNPGVSLSFFSVGTEMIQSGVTMASSNKGVNIPFVLYSGLSGLPPACVFVKESCVTSVMESV